jgi:hypothetical protein
MYGEDGVLRLNPTERDELYAFLFRRRLTCKGCEYSLVGETHKGHIYYGCQIRGCLILPKPLSFLRLGQWP